jgi:GNAT superfamily N-acetyltransferase
VAVVELARLTAGATAYRLRRAEPSDVAAIVELLAADQLGAKRDGGSAAELGPYRTAFEAIDADPAHLLVVVIDGADEMVGTMQLSFIPGLARRGALRAQVEAVRVRADHRGLGLGEAMLSWAVVESRRRGCALVQLTSDKQRRDAHRFYTRLGFVASHEGFKLKI